jgi:hypothetical protein
LLVVEVVTSDTSEGYDYQGQYNPDDHFSPHRKKLTTKLRIVALVQWFLQLKTVIACSVKVPTVSFIDLNFKVIAVHGPDSDHVISSFPETRIFLVVRFISDVISCKT